MVPATSTSESDAENARWSEKTGSIVSNRAEDESEAAMSKDANPLLVEPKKQLPDQQ
jgi:hypothetical protein